MKFLQITLVYSSYFGLGLGLVRGRITFPGACKQLFALLIKKKKCFVAIKRGVGSMKIGFDLVIVVEFWENRLFF